MNDLRALRMFVEICRLGSFSKAAVSLGATQPSISRVMKELEAEVGAPLFLRTGRGVVPSEVGLVARARAENLLLEADQMMVDLSNVAALPSGNVIVAVIPSIAHRFGANVFLAMKRRAPNVRLAFRVGASDQVERWVSEGRADVGLYGFYKSPPEKRARVLLQSDLVLIGSMRRDTLPAEVQFRDLEKYPLTIAAEPNGLRLLLRDTARTHGVTLNVEVDAEALELQMALVQDCPLYSVMAANAVVDLPKTEPLQIASIVNPALRRSVALITTQQRPLSRAARLVVSTLTEVCEVRGGAVV